MKTKYNITEINPKTIKQVRQMIKDSLSVIMEDNNLRFELGNATYDDDSFKFTGFRISLADALTPEQKTLKQIIDMRRKADWLKTIDDTKIAWDRSVAYKLVGYKSRARKKPWVIEGVENGQQYVASDSIVERMFGGGRVMNIVDKLWNVVLANKNKSNNLFIIASEGKWTDTSCDMCVDDMFTVIDWIENKYTNKTIKKNFGQVSLHSQLETYYKEQS